MKTIILAVLGVAGSLVLLPAARRWAFLMPSLLRSREKLEELVRQGNYKDAYEGYRALALDPKDDPTQVGQDLRQRHRVPGPARTRGRDRRRSARR